VSAAQAKVRIQAGRDAIEAEQAKLCALCKDEAEAEFDRDDRRRTIQLAGRTRDVMREFLERATARRIDRLAARIAESFRYLLRKQTLVERVAIDPGNFGITLYDKGGRPLAKERLSEGEKQLFAIAILWGLSHASARPLPAIVDTPMARLDAAHRRNLVEQYFPNASHQVVILSTDTEVDRASYAALAPYVARAYHLVYDEAEKATTGVEGYFWDEARASMT
jgi:DNA sulfur modification protein DndD